MIIVASILGGVMPLLTGYYIYIHLRSQRDSQSVIAGLLVPCVCYASVLVGTSIFWYGGVFSPAVTLQANSVISSTVILVIFLLELSAGLCVLLFLLMVNRHISVPDHERAL